MKISDFVKFYMLPMSLTRDIMEAVFGKCAMVRSASLQAYGLGQLVQTIKNLLNFPSLFA